MALEHGVINIERVRNRLNKLSLVGGQDRGGTTRLSYSKEWRHAVKLVTDWMNEIGMTTRLDAVGNLFGCYKGADPSLPRVLVGSHLDTVPNGGPLDGALGIIAGIEVANVWADNGFVPERSLEVVGTIEEESSLFGIGCLGSRIMVGNIKYAEACDLADKQGNPLSEHIKDLQLGFVKSDSDIFDAKSVKCFLELHIEQGDVLDSLKKPIGIVEKVVGIKRTGLRFIGKLNHGNTPMHKRTDALVAASEFILWINKKAFASDNKFVATIGKLNVLPGQQNIIPGQVDFTLEIRSPSSSCFGQLDAQITRYLKYAEKEYGVECLVVKQQFVEPKNFDSGIVNLLKHTARNHGVEPIDMVSWAGHDAKIISSIIPSGMIFVPSVNGISHSPDEFTHWEDIKKGIEILNGAILNLAES